MAVRHGAGGGRLRVAIVGCGDVAQRWYLPALSELTERVELVACCDSRPEAAEQLALRAAAWWPEVTSHADLPGMFASSQLDAAFTLTPAPRHAEVTQACL
jgi:predicted dehydrogenase